MFSVTQFDIELFNTRNELGALRAIHLTGDDDTRLTVWFLTGEPMPRVEEVEGGGWLAYFPLAHYDAIVDLLRNGPAVRVRLEPPDRITLVAST